jgi:uncharacterized protein (TIGR00725 family)
MDTIQETRFKLYKIIADRFNAEELRTLCFALGIDYDNLQGDGKSGKARELITYLERRNEITQLVEIGKQLRPDISWPSAIRATGTIEGISPEHPRTLQMMVTGGRNITQEMRELAYLVGQQVILRGHTLLSNGSRGVDEVSSEGALAACHSKNLNPNIKIQVFRPRTASAPHFDFGNLQIVGANYDERRNFVVQRSDAIILLGGGSGTAYVARQARIMEKPIIPIGIGTRTETSVRLWYQMESRGKDDLPLIPISDKDLQKIGPSQRDFDNVSVSAVLIAEDLIQSKVKT